MSVDVSVDLERARWEAVDAAILMGVRIFEYREPLTGSQWADRHFYLSPESSSVEGKWKTLPYQVGPLNWMTDDDIEQVNWQKSKRQGYTKLIVITIGYFVEHKRRNIALWQPTDGDRDRFSKTEIDTMLRDCPAVGDKLRCEVGAKSKYNTIEQKVFIGAVLDLKGGKSGGSYRAMTKDVAIYDEADAFDADIDGEGAPFELGDGRLEDSVFPKSIRGTTPKTKGSSHIETEIQGCEFVFYRFLPCPHCGYLHKLEFANMKWDGDDYKKAHFVCPENGCVIKYSSYRWMDERGRWQTDDGYYYVDAEDKFYDPEGEQIDRPERIGIKSWAAYSYFRSWKSIAKKWIEATRASKTGSDSKLKAAVNTILGETWEEKGDKVESGQFTGDRLENYHADEPLPNDILLVTFGGDVQGGKDSRIEIEIVGWGLDYESWSLDYVTIPGDPERDDVWEHLDDQTLRKFVREDGVVLPIAGGMIDSGFLPSRVFDFTRPRKRRNIYATKGKSQYSGPLLGKGSWQGEKGKKTLQFPINTDEAKETVFSRLNKIHTPGPGYCHFPSHYTQDYFKKLTNEEKRPKRRAGQITGHEWVKLGPNEPLDCRTGNLAALARLNPNFTRLERRIEAKREKQNAPVEEKKQPSAIEEHIEERRQQQKPRRKRSFIRNW